MISSPIHIVGAGPAGLCAAIVLARAGADVHLHERYDMIGKRFQGDLQGLENWSITENVLEQLHFFGLTVNFDATPFKDVSFSDGTSSFHKQGSTPLFYLVKRGPFPGSLDRGLEEQARSAGVHIHFQSRFPIEKADIAATGPLRNSIVASDRGLVFPTEHPNTAVGIFHDDLAFKGYSYFLAANGYGCLCTVVFNDTHRLNACFEKTVEMAKRRYNLNLKNARPVGGIGGFSLNHPKQIGKTLYVGEAAGLQDLLWGFGIRSALTSGYLASQALLSQQDYTTLVNQQLAPFLKASIVNRFLWETIKFKSKPVIPHMMRLPISLRECFSSLYRFTPFHRILYPFAKRYAERHYQI